MHSRHGNMPRRDQEDPTLTANPTPHHRNTHTHNTTQRPPTDRANSDGDLAEVNVQATLPKIHRKASQGPPGDRVQPRSQTSEAAETRRVAGLGRAEATHGEVEGPGEAVSSADGAKDSPRDRAQVMRPGSARHASTGHQAALSNTKAPAAPRLAALLK